MTFPLKFVNNNIEDFAIQVTFDPVAGTGDVVFNLSLIRNEDLEFAITILKDAYKTGVSVSGMVKFYRTGEKIGEFSIPKGCTGICTMCSITFDSHQPDRRWCRGDREPHPYPVYPHDPLPAHDD